MKASTVIKHLQKLIDEHGDKKVMFHGPVKDPKDDDDIGTDCNIGIIVAYDKIGNSAKAGNCDHFYLHVYED